MTKVWRLFALLALVCVISAPVWAEDPPPTTTQGWLDRIQHKIEFNQGELNIRANEAATYSQEFGPGGNVPATRFQYDMWAKGMKDLLKNLDRDAAEMAALEADIAYTSTLSLTEAQLQTLAGYQTQAFNVRVGFTNISNTLRDVVAWMAAVDIWADRVAQYFEQVQHWNARVSAIRAELTDTPGYFSTCWDFYVWYEFGGADRLDHIQQELDAVQPYVQNTVNDGQSIALLPVWILEWFFDAQNPVNGLNANWQVTIMAWNGILDHIDDVYFACYIDESGHYGGDSTGSIVNIGGYNYFTWAVEYFQSYEYTYVDYYTICTNGYWMLAHYLTDGSGQYVFWYESVEAGPYEMCVANWHP